MSKLNIALSVFAVALLAFTLLTQRARASLTPEQLYALERVHKLSWHSFVPIAPLLLCLGILQFMTSYRVAVLMIGCLAAAALVARDGRRIQLTSSAAGVPPRCGRAYFIGMSILGVGLFLSAAIYLSDFSWRA